MAPAEPASPTTAMATVIKDRRERYSKKITPEGRRASAKFSYANDDTTKIAEMKRFSLRSRPNLSRTNVRRKGMEK